jgi:hypothetical protein
MEIWKDIVGYEGLYQVSDLGRVRSLDRIIKGNKGSEYLKKGKILKQTFNLKKYSQVNLSKYGVDYHKRVHRLVAETFIPNPEMKPQVNHIDGNKNNNHVINLEWNTESENVIHAYRLGLNVRSKFAGKERRPVYQLKDGKIINRFETITEAEVKTHTPRQNIRQVIKGKRFSANGYQWKDAL